VPFINRKLAGFDCAYKLSGLGKNRAPECGNTGIEIIEHDFINVLVNEQLESDPCASCKRLDISKWSRGLAT